MRVQDSCYRDAKESKYALFRWREYSILGYEPWGDHKVLAMWETTFPRNSHAGSGKDFTDTRAYSSVC